MLQIIRNWEAGKRKEVVESISKKRSGVVEMQETQELFWNAKENTQVKINSKVREEVIREAKQDT